MRFLLAMPVKASLKRIHFFSRIFLLALCLLPSVVSAKDQKTKRNDGLKAHFTTPPRLFVPTADRVGTEFEVPLRFGGALKDIRNITLKMFDPIYELTVATGPATWPSEVLPGPVKREVRFHAPIGSVGTADFRLKVKRRERQADEPWMTLEKERKVRAYSVDEIERQAKELGLYDVEFRVDVDYLSGNSEMTTFNVEVR